MHHGSWLGMGWMLAVWLLPLFGLTYLGWAAARRGAGGATSPEAILRERYARGEIDGEEYSARLQNLGR